MEYREFLDNIRTGIQKKLGENGKAQIIQADKNNGKKLDGLIVKDNSKKVSPAIYLEDYYDQYKKGRQISDITDAVYQIYCQYSDRIKICIEDLSDYGKICKKVGFRIVNFEKNKELLAEIPYVRFLDMAIVFFVLVQCNGSSEPENASFLIHDEHLKMWNVDIGEIYRDALYNTPELFPPKICCMTEILTEILSEEIKQGNDFQKEEYMAMRMELEELESGNHNKMYVLTNDRKVNGAACLLYKNILKEFCEKTGKDFYIIPSSIHEVLLIPAENDIRINDLKVLVKDVNKTELEEEEILSDNIYYYDCEKDNIRIV